MILADYLKDGLDIVFCGTAVGNRSAKDRHYYADPRNRFWRTLHETGLTPEKLLPAHDSRVNEFGIGLTDLVKLHSGNDAALSGEMFDLGGFHQKMLKYAPRFVAFNGREAARVFLGLRRTSDVRMGIQDRTIGPVKVFALPSTSGSACRAWDAKPWRELADLILGSK